MKKGLHPAYHDITIQLTDGTLLKTRSTWGKPGDVMKLDIDVKTHPAWTGVQKLMDTGGMLSKFNNKYAGIGLSKN